MAHHPPFISIEEVEAMSPNERVAASGERTARDLYELPQAFRARWHESRAQVAERVSASGVLKGERRLRVCGRAWGASIPQQG